MARDYEEIALEREHPELFAEPEDFHELAPVTVVYTLTGECLEPPDAKPFTLEECQEILRKLEELSRPSVPVEIPS